MRTALLFVSCLLAVPVAVATACSSSSSSGGGGGSIFCSASLAGTQLCYGYSNLTPDQQNSVNNTCKQSLMGTITTSCPTAGILGCCKFTQGGIQIEECYYSGGGEGGAGDAGVDTSAYQMACTQNNGTWSTHQ